MGAGAEAEQIHRKAMSFLKDNLSGLVRIALGKHEDTPLDAKIIWNCVGVALHIVGKEMEKQQEEVQKEVLEAEKMKLLRSFMKPNQN